MGRAPTHDDETVMSGATRPLSPTHDDETVMNGPPGNGQWESRPGAVRRAGYQVNWKATVVSWLAALLGLAM